MNNFNTLRMRNFGTKLDFYRHLYLSYFLIEKQSVFWILMPAFFEEDLCICAIYRNQLQGRRASQAKNLQKQVAISLLLVSYLV